MMTASIKYPSHSNLCTVLSCEETAVWRFLLSLADGSVVQGRYPNILEKLIVSISEFKFLGQKAIKSDIVDCLLVISE
jgi:hypothetical protein